MNNQPTTQLANNTRARTRYGVNTQCHACTHPSTHTHTHTPHDTTPQQNKPIRAKTGSIHNAEECMARAKEMADGPYLACIVRIYLAFDASMDTGRGRPACGWSWAPSNHQTLHGMNLSMRLNRSECPFGLQYRPRGAHKP